MHRFIPLFVLVALAAGACSSGEPAPTKQVSAAPTATAAAQHAPATDPLVKTLAGLADTNTAILQGQTDLAERFKAIEELDLAPKCLVKTPEPVAPVAFATPLPTSFQAALPTASLGDLVVAALVNNQTNPFSGAVDSLVDGALDIAIPKDLRKNKPVADFLGDGAGKWRDALRAVARTALANPTVLKTTYAAVKPKVVEAIGKWEQEKRDELLKQVDVSILVLAAPVSAELEQAVRYETRVYDQAVRLGAPCDGILFTYTIPPARQAIANLLPSEGPLSEVSVSTGGYARDAFLFGIRRRAEGGPPLVGAYIEILRDLKGIIEAATATAKAAGVAKAPPAPSAAAAPIANPPEALADDSTCQSVLRPDEITDGKWGAICGGHLYAVGSSEKVDGKYVHTQLALKKGVKPPAQ